MQNSWPGLAFVILVGMAAPNVTAQTDIMKEQAWPLEPDGYRGLTWNDPLKNAGAILEREDKCMCTYNDGRVRSCSSDPLVTNGYPEPRLRSCESSLEVGGVEVKDRLDFIRDRFLAAHMTFASSDYETIRDVFVEKYGKPASVSEEPVQNRMGATFKNEHTLWHGLAMSIYLSRYEDTVNEGGAFLSTHRFGKEMDALKDEEKKKAAKSF